jgi:alpha-L-rhamnosidase
MYSQMAGIQSDDTSAGYKHIELKPMPDPSIRWVNAKYTTVYGTIQTQWRIHDNRFNLKVTVPSNTTATIYLPYSKDVKEVGSGVYQFDYKMEQ